MDNEDGKENAEKKRTVSEATAHDQMQKLLDSYQIRGKDLAIINGPEWIQTVVNRLERAIMDGYMEVLDGGKIRHTLVVPQGDRDHLTYRRANGNALKTRSKAREDEKDLAFMGSLANVPASVMEKLDIIDIGIAQRLGQLFMFA